MNIFVKILRECGIKLMTLQSGLNSVKKRMGAIGEDLSKKPGERIYTTKEGDLIHIQKTPIGLSVQRILSKENSKDPYYNSYIGQLAGIKKEYICHHLKDNIKRFQSFLTISTFKDKNTPVSYNRLFPNGGGVIHSFRDNSRRESTQIIYKTRDFNKNSGMKI